jgi:hypothetical protein
MGFPSIVAYGEARPGQPFPDLSVELGPDVPPIQVALLMREEADRFGNLDRFARSSLVRYLRQYLPAGWSNQQEFEFTAASAFADWIALLGSEFRERGERLWKVFRSADDIPPRWLPESAGDPLYLDLWDRAGI